MKNHRFYALLHAERDVHNRPKWTVEKLAEEIYSERSHVNRVLGNSPKRGYQTRWKLAQLFKKRFPRWKEMLEALGWQAEIEKLSVPEPPDAQADVSLATFHVEYD